MPKVVSPETGNEFSSDDIASGFTVLFTLCFLLSRARKYLCVLSSDHDKVNAIQLLKICLKVMVRYRLLSPFRAKKHPIAPSHPMKWKLGRTCGTLRR